MLDAPYTMRALRSRGTRGSGRGGRGCPTVAHTTTSHRPSSIAAAARHTIPTAVAPPRSMRSAKFTDQPQYSATVAGTNSDASATSPAQTTPSMSADGIPASASASAANPAHCSRVSVGVPVNFRSAGRSAMPTMHASPRRPVTGGIVRALGSALGGQRPRVLHRTGDPRLQLSGRPHTLGRDVQPTVEGPAAHLERLDVRAREPPIGPRRVGTDEEAAPPTRAHRHLPVDQERETAEHALLGDAPFAGEQLPDPVGELLVERHGTSVCRSGARFS